MFLNFNLGNTRYNSRKPNNNVEQSPFFLEGAYIRCVHDNLYNWQAVLVNDPTTKSNCRSRDLI